MDSFNDVMDAVKAYCKGRVSDASYRVFIQDLNLLNFEGTNIIILEVPNDVVMRFAAARYADLLKEAFASILGFEVELKFVLAAPAPDGGKAAEKPKLDENDLPSGRYEFTFENFIKGPSNQFAFAAAQAVAANPSGAYNPLFIYGPSGLGKTHLLNAIKIEIQKNHPDFNIVYVDCEKFTNETITAIKTATMEQFRQRYRKADVLLIDDIQFLAGKESTQEEFFHTFNTLQTQGKQIILTSDKPPKEMETLEERIRSRFEWGLMADIGTPDYETRMAILRKKAETDNFDIDDDILNYIASNISSNIRELEGALNKLLAFHNLEHTHITMDIAERELSNIITPDKPREITAQLIIEVVSEHFHISVDQMISKTRSSEIARPRQIAMYLCKTMTSDSLDVIGQLLGGRDHSTIIHGIKKVTKDYEENDSTRTLIETIKKKINPN